jgi:hypothetical protein
MQVSPPPAPPPPAPTTITDTFPTTHQVKSLRKSSRPTCHKVKRGRKMIKVCGKRSTKKHHTKHKRGH